jgi:branched-subunit amino acid transport protein AzlD
MKLLRWVVVAVMLLLLILCATDVAPNVLAYTVIPGLAVVAMIAGSLDRTERR